MIDDWWLMIDDGWWMMDDGWWIKMVGWNEDGWLEWSSFKSSKSWMSFWRLKPVILRIHNFQKQPAVFLGIWEPGEPASGDCYCCFVGNNWILFWISHIPAVLVWMSECQVLAATIWMTSGSWGHEVSKFHQPWGNLEHVSKLSLVGSSCGETINIC